MKIINTKISLRRDTLSNWLSLSGTILQSGEVAIVTNPDGNENLKIGNGISSFGQLPFLYENKFESNEITAKSIAQGLNTKADPTSLATGIYTEANGSFNVVHGIEAQTLSTDNYAFVYNGVNLPGITDRYTSHGEGTFNINPVNGLDGIYIGEKTLSAYLSNYSSISSGTYGSEQELLSSLNIVKINTNDYYELVINQQVDPNTLYIISGDFVNAYGQQIKNLSAPTDSTDATTKQYVDDYIETVSSELNNSINNNTTSLNTAISNLSILLSTEVSTTNNNLSTVSVELTMTKTNVETLSTTQSTLKTSIDNLSGSVDKKLYVDGVSVESLSIAHYSQDEYYQKVVNDEINENELYVISSDYTNLYDKQIKNLADPTDTNDAVNKNYADNLPLLTDDIKNALLSCFDQVITDYTPYKALKNAFGFDVVTNITISESSVSVATNATHQLSTTITPTTISSVNWKSSDTSLVSVSLSGLVKGIAAGTTTVTAYKDGISANCSVTVS